MNHRFLINESMTALNGLVPSLLGYIRANVLTGKIEWDGNILVLGATLAPNCCAFIAKSDYRFTTNVVLTLLLPSHIIISIYGQYIFRSPNKIVLATSIISLWFYWTDDTYSDKVDFFSTKLRHILGHSTTRITTLVNRYRNLEGLPSGYSCVIIKTWQHKQDLVLKIFLAYH